MLQYKRQSKLMGKGIKSVQSGQLKSIKVLKFSPLILLILADVIYFEKSSDLRTFPILIFYILMIKRFKLRANTTFFICLFLFFLIYVQYIFSSPATFEIQYPTVPFGEKLAVWLYLFLVIGVIQKWRE